MNVHRIRFAVGVAAIGLAFAAAPAFNGSATAGDRCHTPQCPPLHVLSSRVEQALHGKYTGSGFIIAESMFIVKGHLKHQLLE